MYDDRMIRVIGLYLVARVEREHSVGHLRQVHAVEKNHAEGMAR